MEQTAYCGHCNQRLTRKAFKEHHRLYFYDGEWIQEDSLALRSDNPSSPISSLDLSPPSPLRSMSPVSEHEPTPGPFDFEDFENEDYSSGGSGTFVRNWHYTVAVYM